MFSAPGRAAVVLLGLALAACEPLVAPPAPPVAVPALSAVRETSAVAEARRYYGLVQGTMLSRGLMRTDSGAPDAPWGARQLAENFLRIALYDEFTATPSGYVARETESRLRRWNVPVRVSLNFGDSYPEAQRATERARVASFLARLSMLTGHPIGLADGPGNFTIAFVNEDERQAMAPFIRAVMPDMTANEITAFTDMPATTYCQVSASSRLGTDTYFRAFAVIRAELPGLLSLLCLHEEIAQGLGLPNDSPRARPSVFNDDQEFALLTPMDEAMLAMLYDRRLRPGMSVETARPIVEMLARERAGGDT